mmetsp:Transcript_29406/g.44479  ORF Transcript_29406/g.44479 Transcript_29406/m.44479 type:complete len:92 (-) Transcript_29406:1111-1386(-)
MSTITQNQKERQLLGKRARVTSESLVKKAEDQIALQVSEPVLMGGDNAKLNFSVGEEEKDGERLESISQIGDQFEAPASSFKRPKLNAENL